MLSHLNLCTFSEYLKYFFSEYCVPGIRHYLSVPQIGHLSFPTSDSDGKESTCNVGDLSLIPGLGGAPGGGHGNPLQNSCLENLMDRGVWRAIVHGITKSQT